MQIMGILNITPDSFSDGGKYLDIDKAIEHALKLEADGADIIDIGAESTRPSAQLVPQSIEWERLKNILPILKTELKKAKISLDSRHYKTIELSLDYIDIINDVTGLDDERITNIVATSKLPTILMHYLTIPADPFVTLDKNQDPIVIIKEWFYRKIDYLSNKGITNIIIDPGLGFGKLPKQSLSIIKNISELKIFKFPILSGHSRKGFLKMFNHTSTEEIDINTALISMYLELQNIDYIRVHNVKMTNTFITNMKLFLSLK